MKLAFLLLVLSVINDVRADTVPVVHDVSAGNDTDNSDNPTLKYLPFIALIDKNKDNSEYWRETEILSLVRNKEAGIDYEKCEQTRPINSIVHLPSQRTVRPICKGQLDYQVCPQCPHFNNHTECELFKDSCRERRVLPSEYSTYCDRKYGKWRAMFLPADYSQCRCCDECIFYRELDQSCMEDEYNFDTEEFLPVTTIDLRAGCNPYWGHPEQEQRSLKCDQNLRRCVPISIPTAPKTILNVYVHTSCIIALDDVDFYCKVVRLMNYQSRRSYRYEPPTDAVECPISCRGYHCDQLSKEEDCPRGAFLPNKDQCNCCGTCSSYQQLNLKCAEYKKTVHDVNGTEEIEVEEEFLEPGCDDGLVCRQGKCQDIHVVQTPIGGRRKRDKNADVGNEPCKRELKYFKKKYGVDGHLHFDAPQCTPLWLYAPVQCRKFVCYCALEDGSVIKGVKVPRVEVSNMNCDCAREKCRTGSDVECDGYGNYKEAVFTSRNDEWSDARAHAEGSNSTSRRIGREIELVTPPAQMIE